MAGCERSGRREMKKFTAFVGIGSFFATVEEFLTVAVLKRDVASYFFTLFVLFPVFLTFVYFSSKLLDRLLDNEPARLLAHFLAYGFIGLMFEWFIIGLSPWRNQEGNAWLMLVFQIGMFSFWATVAFVPRLFLGPQELNRVIRKSLLRFYVPYFLLVYVVGLSVPVNLKFKTIIPLVIIGYTALNVFYFRYFLTAFSRSAAVNSRECRP